MDNVVQTGGSGGPPVAARTQTEWTPEQVDLIKRTVATGSTNDELKLFLYQAKRAGLDPLSRQIHFVKRTGKATIQVAIDGYRSIADRTGLYAGNDDYRYDEGLSEYEHIKAKRGNPTTATATVYKIVGGQRVAFVATVRWSEYYPGDKQGFMWKKMPYFMLGKCAESLALRKAFPQELGGLYTHDEMQQAGGGPQYIREPHKDAERTKDAMAGLMDGGKRPDVNSDTGEYVDAPPIDGEPPYDPPEAQGSSSETSFTIRVTGNTKPNKEELKTRGYRWNKDRFRWEIGITGDDETRKEADELKNIDEQLTLTIVNESNGEKMEI